MSKTICLSVMACAAITLVGCAKSSPPMPTTVVQMENPAGPGSEEPNLSVAPDGRIFMSWLEPVSEGYALKFSIRGNQGEWSAPQTIAQGDNWFVNAADFPSMAVMPDGSLAAHWLGNNEPGSEAYDIDISLSRDSGATWGAPIVPHRDRKPRQHGFVSMLPASDGRLAVVWLDGRQTSEEGEGDMALMYTVVAEDGTIGDEQVLDNRVCECCQTSATATPDGLVVAYRDRSDQEIRDISLVRYTNGQWSQPEPLSKDGWEIYGCPVNGPAISSNGQNTAVAWFTGANDEPRVQVVLSTDSGRTFGKAVRIDDGQPSGHVGVVSLPSGGAVVSWIEIGDQGSEVRLRQVDADGSSHPSLVASSDSGARSGGVPRLQWSGNQAVIAWTDAGDIPRVRTAVLK